jgi:RND family efflux transporter MFP subunit
MVARGALVDDVRSSGVVTGVREAFTVSETQGLIRSVGFNLGDKVVEGQELLRVDDRIAELNMDRAKEQYEAARLELDATEKLAAVGRSSPADLTRARGNASGAKAQYETALKTFNDTRLRAPISGVIASRDEVATVGATIAPGVRVARIVDTSSFRLAVGVGEREVGLIEPGAKAKVYIPAALGEEFVEGTVSAIGAGSDPGTGSFPVVIAFRNGFGGRIKSGMAATVSIQARETTPSVVVPSAAIVRRGSASAVFVEENGKATVREVVPGRRSGVRVELLSGLAEGEKLVVSALTRLRQGAPIQATMVGDTASWE